MTEHDRGAYTPQTDAPLAFDARAPRGGGRRPLPLALIGGGVVLLVLLAAVGMYYSSGVGPSPGAPPTVGQPVETVKTPPTNAVPGDNLAEPGIFTQAPAAGAPAFAPAPEQPAPRAAEAPPPAQTAQAAPVQAAPAPAAAPPPAMAPAAPAVPPASKPVVVATAPVRPVPTTPAPKPVAPAAKPAAAPAPAAAAAGGAAIVQIGAYSSTALADKEFGMAASEFPGFMVGKTKRVEPVDRDGKTLYRTSVVGFGAKATAQAFCDAWKAKGRPCFVR